MLVFFDVKGVEVEEAEVTSFLETLEAVWDEEVERADAWRRVVERRERWKHVLKRCERL